MNDEERANIAKAFRIVAITFSNVLIAHHRYEEMITRLVGGFTISEQELEDAKMSGKAMVPALKVLTDIAEKFQRNE